MDTMDYIHICFYFLGYFELIERFVIVYWYFYGNWLILFGKLLLCFDSKNKEIMNIKTNKLILN